MKLATDSLLNINDGRRTVKNAQIGRGTVLGEFINLYGCTIGRDGEVGQFVEITKGVIIGDRCRVETLSFICDGVTIGNDCVIGQGVMFINDTFTSGGPAPSPDLWEKTIIEDNVMIGANVTVLPCRIGKGAVVEPGSVVTGDVPPGAVVGGNPARVTSEANLEED